MGEWGILSLVVMALLWVFGNQLREVQGQSEKVAVWSTLEQLRAALMIEQLAHHIRATGASAPVEKNPFRLLQTPPPNFAGEMAMQDADKVPPGSWVYDPVCGCVGYRLLFPQWLEPVQAADAVWFRVAMTTAEVRLVPYTQYLWFGQTLP